MIEYERDLDAIQFTTLPDFPTLRSPPLFHMPQTNHPQLAPAGGELLLLSCLFDTPGSSFTLGNGAKLCRGEENPRYTEQRSQKVAACRKRGW